MRTKWDNAHKLSCRNNNTYCWGYEGDPKQHCSSLAQDLNQLKYNKVIPWQTKVSPLLTIRTGLHDITYSDQWHRLADYLPPVLGLATKFSFQRSRHLTQGTNCPWPKCRRKRPDLVSLFTPTFDILAPSKWEMLTNSSTPSPQEAKDIEGRSSSREKRQGVRKKHFP